MAECLPNDKLPGPDGFTNEFINKCWPYIKQEFYNVCCGLQQKKHLIPEYQYFLHHFNPKSGWCGVGVIFQAYFFVEPLHQINHQALANRLHLIIMKLIHHNQYGVIRTRTIQDCLAWSFEYLHLCHHPRKEISISKLHSRKLLIKLSIKQQNKDIGS